MYQNHIKIGIARNKALGIADRWPAHITKISRRQLFEVHTMNGRSTVLASGTLDEIRAWADQNGYQLLATNRLGKSILNHLIESGSVLGIRSCDTFVCIHPGKFPFWVSHNLLSEVINL